MQFWRRACTAGGHLGPPLARGKGLYEPLQEHNGSGQAPPRWKQAITIWLAFFPVSRVFQALFGEALALLPRVLIGTLMLTPVMVFVFIPLSMRLLGVWLRGELTPLALFRCLHQRRA